MEPFAGQYLTCFSVIPMPRDNRSAAIKNAPTTTNNLYGFQIDADGKIFEHGCFSTGQLVKAGIFDNNAQESTGVSTGKVVRPSSASTIRVACRPPFSKQPHAPPLTATHPILPSSSTFAILPSCGSYCWQVGNHYSFCLDYPGKIFRLSKLFRTYYLFWISATAIPNPRDCRDHVEPNCL